MKKNILNIAVTIAAIGTAAVMLCSCGNKGDHFISGKAYRSQVQDDFAAREYILEKAGIDLEAMELTDTEKEALEFLYAYMPLGDMLNYSPDYWLGNIRLTQEAIEKMPWGESLPEREMRHFVLPVRVNNENLDEARSVFYPELSERVAGMSMQEAVLEVNHWCHEKAVYQPTDSRTGSPLSIVRTAFGRCGEESTLLVTALRSVAIPARQVYTPRWAHTDDNHAWVEAWVDGEWHFLGACEPEPVLDLGWFNAPASRGMLMTTNVFGRYDGPEEVLKTSPNYTTINVTDNYAPQTAVAQVAVVDENGSPVPGAKVEFKLYNYAEFYSVATKTADDNGKASMLAGLGDMIVYASDGERFGLEKVSFGKDASVEVCLNHRAGDDVEPISLEVVPPVGSSVIPEVTPDMRAENDRRMAEEDSIRTAYVSTFYNDERAAEYARGKGFPKHSDFLVASRGNHDNISHFLAEMAASDRKDDATGLLGSLTAKDLRDVPLEILEDQIRYTPSGKDYVKDHGGKVSYETYINKVLCPRVATERLTPYRDYFRKAVSAEDKKMFRENPESLVQWCRDSLTLLDDISQAYVQVYPAKVWRTKISDKASRDIFFVAMCRTLGVPAWKDPVTGKVFYETDGVEHEVDFDAAEDVSEGAPADGQATVSSKGKLVLDYQASATPANPKYYTHFSLSVYDNGSFNLLNYPEDATWAGLFKNGVDLACGYYMLVSGSRMSAGNVLADIQFFNVEEGQTTTVPLAIRNDASQLRVIGNFNSEAAYDKLPALPYDASALSESTVLATTGRGYFIVAIIDSGREPTDHALKDISKVAPALEEWGRPILLVFSSGDDCRKFNSSVYNLPENVCYGIDSDGSMRKMAMEGMDIAGKGELPIVIVADTFNRVVFFSQGYTIGMGDSLVDAVNRL